MTLDRHSVITRLEDRSVQVHDLLGDLLVSAATSPTDAGYLADIDAAQDELEVLAHAIAFLREGSDTDKPDAAILASELAQVGIARSPTIIAERDALNGDGEALLRLQQRFPR